MRVPPGVLENIRTREREEPINCLRAMLEKLLTLTIHQTTWKALAEAVEPINPAKAKEIREKDVGESELLDLKLTSKVTVLQAKPYSPPPPPPPH